MRRALLLLTGVLLAACASGPEVNAPGAPTVRHFASTESFGNGARWHLFLFDPATTRSLDDRLALARAAVDQDPACRWVEAPLAEVKRQTLSQGSRYGDTTLAAPLRCT